MRRELGMFVALLALGFLLWASNHDFLGSANVVNTTKQIAMLGILAVGIGFVIITGGIDLSIGSIVGLTGVLIAKFAALKDDGGMGWPVWKGIALAMAVAMILGLIQGLLITRLKLQPFIVTLGFMLLIRGFAQTIAKGGSLSIGDISLSKLADSGLIPYKGDALLPYPVVICLVVIVLATYLLHFTVFGRYLYAIGGNRDAAEYSGINVKSVETVTYVISATLAGVAGICYASYIGQMNQQVGMSFELYAITAAVLGGCSLRGGEGTIIGIVIGTFVMRVIENGIDMFQIKYVTPAGAREAWRLDPNWKNIIIGSTILIAVITDQLTHVFNSHRKVRESSNPPSPVGPQAVQKN